MSIVANQEAGEGFGSLLTEIDHVAIAVNDLDAAIEWYREAFGATVAHREVVQSDGVEEALLAVAESYVQLLTPTRDDSPVAKYLEKRGEGIHHVGYRVDDCAAAYAPDAFDLVLLCKKRHALDDLGRRFRDALVHHLVAGLAEDVAHALAGELEGLRPR